MNPENPKQKKSPFKLRSLLSARCPACHTGSATKGGFSMRDRCPHCNYNFQPEPGFYLGAMVVGFFLTAMLTIPPTIILKLMNVDIEVLIAFPFIEFIFVGTFLLFYCRMIWLHLEYQMTHRLDGETRN
jgi:hypothetical protein